MKHVQLCFDVAAFSNPFLLCLSSYSAFCFMLLELSTVLFSWILATFWTQVICFIFPMVFCLFRQCRCVSQLLFRASEELPWPSCVIQKPSDQVTVSTLKNSFVFLWLVWIDWLERCPINQRVVGSILSQREANF